MYASYVVALKQAPRLPARWVIAAIVAVHAIFVLSPPLALTDIFNYINYGRMEVVHHLNPYTTIPILEPHNDPSFLLSNWHQLLSPYGPLFTLLTFAVVPLGVAGSFWALKGLLMRCEPGDHPARLEVRAAAGSRPAGRGRVRRPEPDRARVGARRRPQRLPDGRSASCSASTCCSGARAGGGRRPSPRAAASRWARVRAWLLPLAALEIGAGAAFVTAVAIKASAAVLLPVVLAGLLRAPRALVQVVLGMIVAGDGRRRGEPAGVRPAHPRPEHAGQPCHEREHPQPDRPGARRGRRDRRPARRAQRRAGRAGGGVLLAGVGGRAPRDSLRRRRARDHRIGLGERGAAGDAQLGAAVVRAVGASAGGAVELAQAAHGCARDRACI